MTQGRIGVTRPGAFEIGVRQIIEGDDFLELEQVAFACIQKGFQCRFVLVEPVGDPVELISPVVAKSCSMSSPGALCCVSQAWV